MYVIERHYYLALERLDPDVLQDPGLSEDQFDEFLLDVHLRVCVGDEQLACADILTYPDPPLERPCCRYSATPNFTTINTSKISKPMDDWAELLLSDSSFL